MTARSSPTMRVLPNLCPTSAQPRASNAVALPNLPDLSGTRVYVELPTLPLSPVYAIRLGRLGRSDRACNPAALSEPNLGPTSRRSGAIGDGARVHAFLNDLARVLPDLGRSRVGRRAICVRFVVPGLVPNRASGSA